MTATEEAMARARANAATAEKNREAMPVEVRDDHGVWRVITAQPTQSKNPAPIRYAVRVRDLRCSDCPAPAETIDERGAPLCYPCAYNRAN